MMEELKMSMTLDKRNENPIEKMDMPFWTISSNGKVKINQIELIKFLQKGGFYKITSKNDTSVVRVVKNVVSDAPDFELIDFIKSYLISNNQMKVLEAFSTGVPNYINKGKLNLLDTVVVPIDRDPKDESWFYFNNTAVKVTENGIELIDYENLPHVIWASRILDRDYFSSSGKGSDFEIFLFNLAGQNQQRFNALKSIIGYLLHRYNSKSNMKAVIFLDEIMSSDGTANGGTGKTLVTEALGKMRELVGMDGKDIKATSSFKNQRITQTTDLIRYDDVLRNFSLETLYSIITSGVTVERKYRDEFYISPDNAPKLVISSNYPVKGTGGSTDARRRCEFEVSNHYGLNHQPIDDFGKHFYDDWDSIEWNAFDTLMMSCVEVYFQKGLIIPDPINLVKNKLVNDTCQEFVEFAVDFIQTDTWIDKRESLRVFVEKYPPHSGVTSHQFTKWLKEYASQMNLKYEDKSSGGKYNFILETIKSDENEN